jgi:hypothetical protein
MSRHPGAENEVSASREIPENENEVSVSGEIIPSQMNEVKDKEKHHDRLNEVIRSERIPNSKNEVIYNVKYHAKRTKSLKKRNTLLEERSPWRREILPAPNEVTE